MRGLYDRRAGGEEAMETSGLGAGCRSRQQSAARLEGPGTNWQAAAETGLGGQWHGLQSLTAQSGPPEFIVPFSQYK